MSYQPKPFTCKNCHWILGEIYKQSTLRITRLRVYRHSQIPEQGADLSQIAAHIKFVAIHVNDAIVLCEHCGTEMIWYANQDAIEEMIKKRLARQTVQVAG